MLSSLTLLVLAASSVLCVVCTTAVDYYVSSRLLRVTRVLCAQCSAVLCSVPSVPLSALPVDLLRRLQAYLCDNMISEQAMSPVDMDQVQPISRTYQYRKVNIDSSLTMRTALTAPCVLRSGPTK